MASSLKEVAVAIMAKAPRPGTVKTRLCPPLLATEAAALYRCFLLDKIATVGALMVAFIVYMATRAMRHPVATGTQGMIGANAEVVADFTGKGKVRYGGELWNARSERPLRAGDEARIVKVEGLTLWVEPQ